MMLSKIIHNEYCAVVVVILNYPKHNVQFNVSCFPCSPCDDDDDDDNDDEVERVFECVVSFACTIVFFCSREVHLKWMKFNSIC